MLSLEIKIKIHTTRSFLLIPNILTYASNGNMLL